MMTNKDILVKYKYLLVIIGVLLVVVGFVIGRFSDHFTKSNEAEKHIPSPTSLNDNRTFFWEIYPELVIPNTGKKISGDLSLLDSNDTVIPLAAISNDFPALVFRYSKFDCHVCVDQVLDKLINLFDGNEKKVCLMVDGYSARELRIKYKERGLNFPIYILEKEKLGLSLENKNLPFLFVFEDSRLEINKIFIPFKEHSNQTDTYLKHIIKYMNE